LSASRLLVALGVVTLLIAGAPRPKPSRPADAGPGGRPLAPVAGGVVTQPFGCTSLAIEPVAPWCPGGHFHTGLDLAAPYGAEVEAVAAGTAHVGLDPGGYGRYVTLDHGGGLTTLYGHLSSVSIASGASVQAGQEIGRVGSTGRSTGAHLHFEVRWNGRPADPGSYLGIAEPTAPTRTARR
jgi:murein DD-endopeptidase MepM/ murein hydrolase activator NlpD